MVRVTLLVFVIALVVASVASARNVYPGGIKEYKNPGAGSSLIKF